MSKSIQLTNLGTNITNLRKEVGLTQDELGMAINVTGSTVSNYERGNVEKPDTSILLAIAEYFNVEMSDLWKRDEKVVDKRQLAYIGRKIQLSKTVHIFENSITWGDEKFIIVVKKSGTASGELVYETKILLADGTPLADVLKTRLIKEAWSKFTKEKFSNLSPDESIRKYHGRPYHDRFMTEAPAQ